MTRTVLLILCLASPGFPQAAGPFRFRETGSASLELTEAGKPVLVYNHGDVFSGGVDDRYRRSSYVHPLFAPDGTVVTDDFPKDHPHHRGLFWAWPEVRFEGKTYDVWDLRGMRQRFVRWTARKTTPSQARLGIENGWFLGDRKAARERVELVILPAKDNRRTIDVTLLLEAVGSPVEFSGREKRGYGGFSIRLLPRENTVVRTDAGVEEKDTDNIPHRWAELESGANGKRAGARIEIDPGNPGAPNGWCLRRYGYIGVSWPGLETRTLRRGVPVKLKYRVVVFSNR